jgi:hypothetical protein
MGVSLAVDSSGYPIIAYQDATVDMIPQLLKVARPVDALGLGIGNCGPTEGLFQTWYCETIDAGGSETDEAGAVSIAVDPNGLASMAYHEADSYDYKGNLKLAYQQWYQAFLPLALKSQ